MQRVQPPSGPRQYLALDFLGPFPTGKSLLVTVDYYNRFWKVAVTKSVITRDVIRVLTLVFGCFGYPFCIKTDNGPQFVPEEYKSYLSNNGIEHVTSPPLWPQAYGEVEVNPFEGHQGSWG